MRRYYDGHPPDTGCHLHPKCTECPEPVCIYDGGVKGQASLQTLQKRREAHQKRANLVWLYQKQGMTQAEAVSKTADILGCLGRTVYRSLAKSRRGQ